MSRGNRLRVLGTEQLPAVPDYYMPRPEEERLSYWVRGKLSGATRSPNVVLLHGTGSQGKSTLVQKIVNELVVPGPPPCEVFAVSFAGQGRNGWSSGPTPTDKFFSDALQFFDVSTEGVQNDRARALASHLKSHPAVLVLDGIEAVLKRDGKPTDRVRAFLTELAEGTRGICLLVGRDNLAWLPGEPGVGRIELRPLPHGDRRRLFVRIASGIGPGSKSGLTPSRLPDTPLGIELASGLASFGPANRGTATPGNCPSDLSTLLDAVSRPFSRRGPHAQLLFSVCLYDGAVPVPAVEHLRTTGIPGLTAEIPAVGSAGWDQVLDDLRGRYLLLPPARGGPDSVAMHPEVRHFFAGKLYREEEAIWRAGHREIGRLFAARAPAKPESMSDMHGLFQAVEHLCLAGEYRAAYHDVYWPRIRRESDDYARRRLAANDETVHALAYFFNEVGDPLVPLDPERELSLRQDYAFALWTSDLAAAYEGIARARVFAERNGLWAGAARLCLNLAYHDLLKGKLSRAVDECRTGRRYAQRGNDDRLAGLNGMLLGCVLCHRGRRNSADREFARSRLILGDAGPDRTFYPHLFYLEYLWASERNGEAIRHLGGLNPGQLTENPLDVGLRRLAEGLALLNAGGRGGAGIRRAEALFLQSLESLRRAGSTDEIPRAELAIARANLLSGNTGAARLSVAMARDTADRYDLALFRLLANFLEAQIELADGNRQGATRIARRVLDESAKFGLVLLGDRVGDWTSDHDLIDTASVRKTGRDSGNGSYGLQGEERVIELIDQLSSAAPDGRIEAAGELARARLGSEDVLDILESLPDQVPRVQILLIKAVGRVLVKNDTDGIAGGRAGIVPKLLGIAYTPFAAVRKAAMHVLRQVQEGDQLLATCISEFAETLPNGAGKAYALTRTPDGLDDLVLAATRSKAARKKLRDPLEGYSPAQVERHVLVRLLDAIAPGASRGEIEGVLDKFEGLTFGGRGANLSVCRKINGVLRTAGFRLRCAKPDCERPSLLRFKAAAGAPEGGAFFFEHFERGQQLRHYGSSAIPRLTLKPEPR